ncbi:hypothetical protein JAAARDRAFT_57912 [Jaapia argillacea MUCL 33604]|uniref:Uncharacterized protein n=1 Tax=Jaapia argillacea MUCL 33604 TaxID=933084 RepID=A0A067Q6C9_9AGAM|nr:hypothetical protein JAAARDRAFT_57912 [Jaapia argillacea MUCL 33604]
MTLNIRRYFSTILMHQACRAGRMCPVTEWRHCDALSPSLFTVLQVSLPALPNHLSLAMQAILNYIWVLLFNRLPPHTTERIRQEEEQKSSRIKEQVSKLRKLNSVLLLVVDYLEKRNPSTSTLLTAKRKRENDEHNSDDYVRRTRAKRVEKAPFITGIMRFSRRSTDPKARRPSRPPTRPRVRLVRTNT